MFWQFYKILPEDDNDNDDDDAHDDEIKLS